jgi:uncharacterized protein
MGRFQLTKKGDQWHFDLQAGNYEPILHSEMYESRAAADNGIESVRKNAVREGAFVKTQSANGQWHFVLKSTNGQVVGQSEMYESEAGCDNGIASVIKNAPDATVVVQE